ncbi:alpha/beta hydrolase [bacterium SCSIO 12696]|nr:alpha/beta hydrolase [bacterium SCSIO 12696]
MVTEPVKPAVATLVLAHGAGAPMDSDFMEQLSSALSELGICVVRFEFPYMQQRRRDGKKRPPDRQPRLLEHLQAMVEQAQSMELPAPLLVGGKSMGGRMASLLADCLQGTEPGRALISGVCCFGYPFFPGGKKRSDRVEHLLRCKTPTLIVQGTRDPFGKLADIDPLNLSAAVSVHWLEAGDHDFKPTVRSGIAHQQHIDSAARAVLRFVQQIT